MTRKRIVTLAVILALIAGGIITTIVLLNTSEQQEDSVQEDTGTDAHGEILPDKEQSNIQQEARNAAITYAASLNGVAESDIFTLDIEWVGVGDESKLGVLVFLSVSIGDQTENQSYIATFAKSKDTWQLEKIEKSNIPYIEAEG